MLCMESSRVFNSMNSSEVEGREGAEGVVVAVFQLPRCICDMCLQSFGLSLTITVVVGLKDRRGAFASYYS